LRCLRMPIMSFDGLGCRAYAAEITPMEPVWFLTGTITLTILEFATADSSGLPVFVPVCSLHPGLLPARAGVACARLRSSAQSLLDGVPFAHEHHFCFRKWFRI